MWYGIVREAVSTIYGSPALTLEAGGQILSAITDEVLHGMLLAVEGPAENGFLPVRTFYGYMGYLPEGEIRLVEEEEAVMWEHSPLFVTSGICVDVVSLPGVRGVRLKSLFRGSVVQVIDWDSQEPGWARVRLADGQTGYMRNQYLWEKKFCQEGVRTGKPEQRKMWNSEEEFRRQVVETARTYLGIQYRWGGRSTAGIDCSGLTSASYMLNGILIFRDAKLAAGYPVHEIPQAQMRPGDLLYFPGHIALYAGNGWYIHSTGRIGSGGVVYNSLKADSPSYRQDLAESLYAVGSIFS